VSIVAVSRITLYGYKADKSAILEDLQQMGCLHIISLQPQRGPSAKGPSSQAREALKFLLTCRQHRRPIRDASNFDAAWVERQALEIKKRMQTLADERDFLEHRIGNVRPWGDFAYPPAEALRGLRLWFFTVPLNDMKSVAGTDLVWQVAGKDNRFAYVVVVSENEPQGMPVPRTLMGNRSLSDLELRLDAVERELEDLQAERASLTRWRHLYAASLFRLEDREALTEAMYLTYDADPLFALQAWIPSAQVSEVTDYTERKGLALEIASPGPGDDPPTLLRNPPTLASGQDLVSFYMTPGYWLWDPSALVFFSFAVFFGMILSDAGYGLVMGLGLALGWKKMKRSDSGRRLRVLFATLVGATIAWGTLVGSYFGFALPEGSWLGRLNVLDLNDFDRMMKISILIGVGHLVLANLADMRRRGLNAGALASLGWIAVLIGAVLLWYGTGHAGDRFSWDAAGVTLLIAGAVAIVFFTPPQGTFLRRLMAGLLALTKVTNAFGDALSYLRLFALGLASASLAVAFNDLSAQVRSHMPGLGVLLASLVFLVGHGLNFVLAVVSGFIHGLRLNFIEFFNWSIPEEGKPFRPFAKKEMSAWNQ